VAWLLTLQVGAFGVVFLIALYQESGSWNPNPAEALIVPLSWLGMLLLPLSGWILLKAPASNRQSADQPTWSPFQPRQVRDTPQRRHRLPSIVMVGRYGYQAFINWPGVLLVFMLTLTCVYTGALIVGIFLIGEFDLRTVGLPLPGVIIGIMLLIKDGLQTPVEQLPDLDGSGEKRSINCPGNSASKLISIYCSPVDGMAQASVKDPMPDGLPRISPTTIWGAIWALFPLLTVLFFGISFRVSVGTSPPLWISFLTYPVIFIIFSAPFGTTLLGWTAVMQIRHSMGRLYGLGLAVFEGLLYPLLALNGLIGLKWWEGSLLYREYYVNGQNLRDPLYTSWHKPFDIFLAEHPFGVVVLLTLVTGGVLSFFIARRVWRAVNKPLEGTTLWVGVGGVIR